MVAGPLWLITHSSRQHVHLRLDVSVLEVNLRWRGGVDAKRVFAQVTTVCCHQAGAAWLFATQLDSPRDAVHHVIIQRATPKSQPTGHS